MKTLLFALGISGLFVMGGEAKAQDKVIQSSELPSTATKFVNSNFKGEAITRVEKDVFDSDYEVYFTNGIKAEFDKNGDWKEVDGNDVIAIPTDFIDGNIVKYVKTNYSTAKIVKIEKDFRSFDVELSNGVELKFDSKGQFLRMD